MSQTIQLISNDGTELNPVTTADNIKEGVYTKSQVNALLNSLTLSVSGKTVSLKLNDVVLSSVTVS